MAKVNLYGKTKAHTQAIGKTDKKVAKVCKHTPTAKFIKEIMIKIYSMEMVNSFTLTESFKKANSKTVKSTKTQVEEKYKNNISLKNKIQ